MKAISSLSKEAQVDPIERQLGVGVHQFADVAAEGLGVDLVAADVERIEGAEHPVGILGDQPGEKVGDAFAGLAVELAEHAVIERGDDAAREDAEVAWMRIGVEEAVNEDLLQQDPRSGDGHVGRIERPAPDAVAGHRRRRHR